MLLLTTAIILLLIGITGLYVAAEFSAVSARRPRLAQLRDDGNLLAEQALAIIEDPKGLDTFVAACQLGITLAGLILGFYGQSQLNPLLLPLLARWESVEVAESIATGIVLFGLTVVTVILGELIPKNLGVQMPERLLLLTVRPMRWSMWLFKPLIWIFNGSGTLILRLFGVSAMSEHAHVHSPEEIMMLVEESSQGGLLGKERRLLINTLGLRDVTARKVMIPRNRMLTAEVNQSPETLLELLSHSNYSRLPLHEGSIDKIVGFVHLKDLLFLVYQKTHQPEGAETRSVSDVMRPVVVVPETIAVEGILESMQRDRNYLVIVADEYGGTAGMITVEDLFEEIIGEFYDEFDISRQMVRIGSANRLFVRGDVQIDDLNEWLDFQLPTENADTIGGLIFSILGKVPDVGDEVALHMVRNGRAAANETDGDELVETLLSNERVETKGINSETETHEATGETTETIINVRVEKMENNGVREVSFEVTDQEIELLHKHEIF